MAHPTLCVVEVDRSEQKRGEQKAYNLCNNLEIGNVTYNLTIQSGREHSGSYLMARVKTFKA